MSDDNLPAVRAEHNGAAVVRRDTDSWTEVVKDVALLAESVAKTTFVPEALRNNVAGTAAAILYGREIGLPPMTALQTTTVIKGRVGIYAEMQRAMILAAGHELEFRETSSSRCTIAGRRAGSTSWTTATYTLDDARLAGHLQSNPNYSKNPVDMLLARATTRLAKMLFPDVIRGMGGVEELIDEAGSDGYEPTAAATSTTKVQRRTRRATQNGGPASLPPAASGDGPGADFPPPQPGSSPPPPPLPGEPGYEDGDGLGVDPAQGKAMGPGPSSQTDDGAGPGRDLAGTAGAEGGSSPSGAPAPSSLSSAGGPGVHAEASDATDGTVADRTSGTPRTREPEPPADHDEAEIIDTAKPASKAILRALRATFNRLGFTPEDRETRIGICEAITGETLTSSNDLSHDGARKVSATLARLETKADVVRLMKEIANSPDGEVPDDRD